MLASRTAAVAGDEFVAPSHPSTAPNPKAPLTRFERARILGARALQISLGAPILVEVPVGEIDPVAIAELEAAAGVIPITVRRGQAA